MTVRSSAYDTRCVFEFREAGMSCLQKLETVGESTKLCGTLFV